MTLVKICGVRSPEVAIAAAEAGADFVGLMFAESKRRMTPQECYDIVEALKAKRTTQGPDAEFDGPARGDVSARSWFGVWADAIEQSATRWRPLIVGVFADMPADEVNDIANTAGLDLVQLSGGETQGYIGGSTSRSSAPSTWRADGHRLRRFRCHQRRRRSRPAARYRLAIGPGRHWPGVRLGRRRGGRAAHTVPPRGRPHA